MAMKLEFESDRLAFRPLSMDDLDIMTEIGTDPEVMKYVAPTDTPELVVRQMPDFMRRCAGCIGFWSVTDQFMDEKIGTCSLTPLPIEEDDTPWKLVAGDDLPDREIEVGYMVKRSAWGRGYGTEICARLLQFAFEDSPLQEVIAVIDERNSASRRVLNKCGMTYEGLRRAYAEQCPGFRMTRRQWLELGDSHDR